MRIVLTTVLNASVEIEGKVVGQIGRGFCLLVGFTHEDNKETVDKMVDKMLSLLNNRLKESYFSFEFSDNLKKWILDSSYSPIYGARPIKRFIQNKVETEIANKIISQEVDTKSKYLVDYENGKVVVKKL